MSARIPLPLRWLDSPPPLLRGPSSLPRSLPRVCSVYKPSGLPYFSASQVSASPDPRRLFTLQPSRKGGGAASAVQPNPDDTSDSLSSRLVDGLPLGSTPHVALPLTSSLLLQHQQSHTSRTGKHAAATTAATVNGWTSRYKGVTLVSFSRGDALFLRNASRMGFVTQTFHVLVRLPRDVAANARGHFAQQQAAQERQRSVSRRKRMLNPYVREIAESQRTEREGGGDYEDSDALGLRITGVASGLLPASLRHEALLEGSLVDWRTGRLRFKGSLSGFLRADTPLSEDALHAVKTSRRLASLFLPAAAAVTSDGGTNDTTEGDGAAGGHHPWMPPHQRLVVSVDVSARQLRSGRGRRDDGQSERAGSGRGGGRRVTVWYRLLAMGSHPESNLALYEVSGAHVAAEEVAALFAAEGFYAVNDFANDGELAAVMARTAAELRRYASETVLAKLPMALKHRLQSPLAAEEFVGLPLMRQPLLASDSWALQQLQHDASQYAKLNLGMLANGGGEELLSRLQRSLELGQVEGDPRFHKHTDMIGRLLYESLDHSKTLSDADCNALLGLTMGSGVECVGIAYPDPASTPTALAMQHAMARFEANQLGDEHREELRESMQFIHSCSAAPPQTSSAALPYGTTSVPRGWLSARAAAVAEDIGFSFAAALTAPTTFGVKAIHTREDGAGAVPARVADLTEVPPAYADFFAEYRKTVTSTRSSGSLPSLLPSRDSLRALLKEGKRRPTDASFPREATHTQERADARTGSSETGMGEEETDGTPRPVISPLFVRVEELGLYQCANCGEQGHDWRCCPHTNIHDLAQLPNFREAADDTDGKLPLEPATAAAVETSPKRSRANHADSATTEDVLSTAADVSRLLAAQEHELASSAADGSAPLIAVPNMAPTVELNPHAVRREQAKPAMQRRSLRCAYCHGKHHISQCPRLRDGGGQGDPSGLLELAGPGATSLGEDAAVVDRERVRNQPEKLFCIKCGAHGHLYTACPSVPEGLHPATHCPICLQSFHRVHHRPPQCPRRVSLPSPSEYLPSGVPRSYVVASGHQQQRWGGYDERRPRHAPSKRRRGSMLIADSFVDGKE